MDRIDVWNLRRADGKSAPVGGEGVKERLGCGVCREEGRGRRGVCVAVAECRRMRNGAHQ